MGEVTIKKNINGISVLFTDRYSQNSEIKPKTQQTAEHAAIIAKELGNGWSVELYGDNWLKFHFNDGYMAGGYTFSGHNHETNPSRSDYWKFEFTGDYPRATKSNDSMYMEGQPRQGINISKKGAAQKLAGEFLKNVVLWTRKAHEHNTKIEQRDQCFVEQMKKVATVTGDKMPVSNILDRGYDRHRFDLHLSSMPDPDRSTDYGVRVECTVFQYGRLETKIDGLTVAELQEIVDLLRDLRTHDQ